MTLPIRETPILTRAGGSGLPLDRSERVATRRPASDYRRKAPKEIGQSVRRANYKLVQQRYPAHFTIRPTDLR